MPAKKITQAQAWGRDGLMAVSAVRYCLGRMTYITGDCADWLIGAWQELPVYPSEQFSTG